MGRWLPALVLAAAFTVSAHARATEVPAEIAVADGRPSIRSIDVSPNPLLTGETFTIAVTTSPDVTRATATVRFHTREKRSLEIPLTQQGSNWIGAGLVPADLRLRPHKDEAEVTVLALNAAGRRAEAVVNVDVSAPAISAVLTSGVLTVTGDNRDNTLAVTRDAAGTISVFVNGSPFAVSGGVPTTTNTSLIRISGFGGNDTLLVDDANGPMPPANLFGGEGNDALTGSANTDELDGGSGNDSLFGRDGNDTLVGGTGNDTLTGGRGVDGHFGSEGDDQIVWNPGDGNDLVEGEDGEDTLVFVGANASEAVDISPAGQRLRFFRNPGNIIMDCDGIEQVVFQALAGNDTVIVNDLAATQVRHVSIDLSGSQTNIVVINGTETNDVIAVTGSTNGVVVAGLTATVSVIGGEQTLDELIIDTLGGADVVNASGVEAGLIDLTLKGGLGNDRLIGGQGNDLLIGAQGTDVVLGGAGDDTLLWNPGDGSDVNEGQAGQDTMLFNGAGADEAVDISANGPRVRLFRNPGNITMDGNEIELIQFNALGGADTIAVNDLTGTGVDRINLDLATPEGAVAGDDTVVINGTKGNDRAVIAGTAAGVSIVGLSAIVDIVGSDPALDQLVLHMLDGDDVAEASDLLSGVINLTLDGGPANDTLIGSAGADMLLGGEGDDVLVGGPGLDVLDGGPGDNVLTQD
jgi:Ca2+-binding RTX toxin-like protein